MAANKKNLLLLFDRPQEPVFMPKGKDNVVFDVPDNYLADRYRPIGTELETRFGADANQRVTVRPMQPPDLRVPMELDRHEPFSLFIPKHRRIAGRLIDIFMGARTIDELQSVAIYARDRLNPLLFNYAFSVALLHRQDTKGSDLPNFIQTFPDKFVDSKVFGEMREEAAVVPEGQRMPIIIPRDYTASDLEDEHRLWYFREDMGLNVHHWHWHLVYPTEASDRSIVDKDRRGEIFFYFHNQMMGRYNIERFSNRMARVKRFNNFREPIPEGYFPKLDSLVASRSWPPRMANSVLRDLNREADQLKVDVATLERWRDRFFEAVHQGFVVDERGNRIPLDERRGIDILGNLLDSSILSVNRQFYGDLHNFGHVFLSYIHDPDHRHLETFGTIGDNTTSCRDPAFYRWHAFVDDLFQEHKESLPPYTAPELNYQGITVTGIDVVPDGGGQANMFDTFWQQSDINFTRGLDFLPRGDVFARVTHLQHTNFTYNIIVNNAASAPRNGTCRIFMGPKNDERGVPMLFRDQRLLLIEMDRFVVQLRPGANTIRRSSLDSSLTVPFERTFRSLEEGRGAVGSAQETGFNFCGCGWPQHMLVPKGLPEGLPCDLFVMISNYDNDRIDQDLVGICNDASSFCGVRDRRYPDQRAMGFPFDRLPRQGVDRLSSFVFPNMFIRDVVIRNSDRTVVRGGN